MMNSKKIYICKNCGEHEAVAPKCNKCMTACPKCLDESWRNGHTNCTVCLGAGAAMPDTPTEKEMLDRAIEEINI